MILCPQSTEHPRGKPCQRLQVAKMSAGDKEQTPQLLFVKALASRGRLEAITQQMGYHPQYLESFLRIQHYLLHMDGPLPFDCRHYIAIMAAARHRCRYLVNLHVLQFLRVGGDPQWLRGLDCIPHKLRRLSEINKILAHRPWLIGKEHIEKLLKTSEQSWSLAELVHAVVLLAHYHALASFAFGCGCEQDTCPEGRGLLKLTLPGSLCFCEVGNGCNQDLLHLNRKRSLDSCVELESLRERIHRLQVESEAQEEMRLPERDEGLDGEIFGPAELSCYVQDPNFGYQDFALCDENHTQIFRVQDYSWEDHGFSLVNRLYSDIGHLLDEKFRKVDGLQSCAMAKRQGCEHATFKRGIWNYIHCMFGIRYDDYDYAEVNHLLERILKLYIKTVTCSPEKMNPEMFERFWKQFKHSEKVQDRNAAVTTSKWELLREAAVTERSKISSAVTWAAKREAAINPPSPKTGTDRSTLTFSSWKPGFKQNCCMLFVRSLTTWSPRWVLVTPFGVEDSCTMAFTYHVYLTAFPSLVGCKDRWTPLHFHVKLLNWDSGERYSNVVCKAFVSSLAALEVKFPSLFSILLAVPSAKESGWPSVSFFFRARPGSQCYLFYP